MSNYLFRPIPAQKPKAKKELVIGESSSDEEEVKVKKEPTKEQKPNIVKENKGTEKDF